VPYCLQLIDGIYIDTKPEVITSFRPKAARRENLEK
ncbi:MAG: molybdopterin adenylyltransferase, partial [Haemophilus parainfluenzae]|nr:molybdopterin adenylyltransferase [Haemophilus parainfluenzae]